MERNIWFSAQAWLSHTPLHTRHGDPPSASRRRLPAFRGACSLHLSASEQLVLLANASGASLSAPLAGPAAPDAVFLQFASTASSPDVMETSALVEPLLAGAGDGPLGIRLVLEGRPWHLDIKLVRQVLVSPATYDTLPHQLTHSNTAPGGLLARAADTSGGGRRPEFVCLALPHVMLNIYQGRGAGGAAGEQEPLDSVAAWVLAACQDAAALAGSRAAPAAGNDSSSSTMGEDATALLNASLWLEGAACEAQQMALLCGSSSSSQQQGPGQAGGLGTQHLLDSLAHLHAGLRQQPPAAQ